MKNIFEIFQMATKKQRKAQTFLEYVIILTIVTSALYAVTPQMKRGIQSMIKVAADLIGTQEDAEQSRETDDDGYMVYSNSQRNAVTSKARTENAGAITYTFNDTISVATGSSVNLGIIEQ
ncbi:hypothetical protein ACFL49_02835 [Candidatus Omnitrophota bacterium]